MWWSMMKKIEPIENIFYYDPEWWCPAIQMRANYCHMPQNWEHSIIFPAYISYVLCNDLYGMVYFLDIAEKTVPVYLVITGKPGD